MSEYFEICSKKGRGMARRSLEIIEEMYFITRAAQPITGRGVRYKLFTAIPPVITAMSKSEMQRVYRLLKEARERGDIPWEWIVDETRSMERTSTWSNPEEYARCVARSYRRDFWDQQPIRCEVWSEKGTVRGVLAPVLDQYAVGFRVIPPSMRPRATRTAGKWSFSMSAISIRPDFSCRRRTSRSGSPNTTATMWTCGGLR